MRPVNAILRALSRAMRHDLGSFATLKVNNFFLFVLFLSYSNILYRMQPHSAYPFLLLVGFLLLFPMSSDPLAKIPAARFGLWPLDASQGFALRLASVALSPVFWIALILLLLTARSLALAFVALAIAMQAVIVTAGSPRWNAGVRLGFPGKLGPLIAAAIRQMLSVLDTYIALLLAIGGCAYRFFFRAPDPAAYPIFALLIALALSTYAQCLFGLDNGSALTRYRLLPLAAASTLADPCSERHRLPGDSCHSSRAAEHGRGSYFRIDRAGDWPLLVSPPPQPAVPLAIHRRPRDGWSAARHTGHWPGFSSARSEPRIFSGRGGGVLRIAMDTGHAES